MPDYWAIPQCGLGRRGCSPRLCSPHGLSSRSLLRSLVALGFALLALTAAPSLALGEDMVNVNGRVVADGDKAPLADAAVTVVDDKNKVVAEGKTDVEGKYALSVPRK